MPAEFSLPTNPRYGDVLPAIFRHGKTLIMTGFLVEFKGYYGESDFIIIEDKEVESMPA
ncbi:hypothetical protein [Paenibacillus andongensis]|uniref:hypothetical protein n=1 Tax=Paenibacillus andongensis TaxID=2975482 RepID=UPI0021BB62CA|nr:hypothetical protein [Paenibacillus andongensis]